MYVMLAGLYKLLVCLYECAGSLRAVALLHASAMPAVLVWAAAALEKCLSVYVKVFM